MAGSRIGWAGSSEIEKSRMGLFLALRAVLRGDGLEDVMSEAERVVAARLVAVLRAELDRPAKSTPEETLAVIQARRLLDRVGGRSESLLAMRRLSARGRGGAR